MCWNSNISLNTFVFSSAVLIFIFYNNTYTQYKVSEFNSSLIYLLFFSYTSMQLVEYFLWNSIKKHNIITNKIFSIIGWILIRIIQPLMILLVIPDKFLSIKKILFSFYFILLIIVSLYKHYYNPIKFITTVASDGHLNWKWVKLNSYEQILFIGYLIILSTLFIKYPMMTIFIILFFFYSYFKYDTSFGSMWCWIINSLLLYFIIKILFILPYNEYNKLC